MEYSLLKFFHIVGAVLIGSGLISVWMAKPTTHSDPTYVVDGIVHYCVANMPGAVPRTSTFALNNATLPFVLAIADKGWREALRGDAHLRAGLNISDGKITYSPVGKAHGLPITPVEEVLGL